MTLRAIIMDTLQILGWVKGRERERERIIVSVSVHMRALTYKSLKVTPAVRVWRDVIAPQEETNSFYVHMNGKRG